MMTTEPTKRKTLKALREERGWSQLEVAYHLKVSLSTVANLEVGRHQPRMEHARAIASLFDVPLDSIEWLKKEKSDKKENK